MWDWLQSWAKKWKRWCWRLYVTWHCHVEGETDHFHVVCAEFVVSASVCTSLNFQFTLLARILSGQLHACSRIPSAWDFHFWVSCDERWSDDDNLSMCLSSAVVDTGWLGSAPEISKLAHSELELLCFVSIPPPKKRNYKKNYKYFLYPRLELWIVRCHPTFISRWKTVSNDNESRSARVSQM